jgi:long-chain acyl-CoA synthetase
MLIDQSEVFDQCMLYNNQHPYTVGLFVVNRKALLDNLKNKDMEADSPEAVDTSFVLIEQEFRKYRSGGAFEDMFPQRWLPTAIGIVVEPFSEENGLINSTLKMMRNKVTERYHDLLVYLYTAEGKSLNNDKNRQALQKIISG